MGFFDFFSRKKRHEMHTTLLSKDAFAETMYGKMSDVTETAEAVVDIWPYAKQLCSENLVSQYAADNQLIEIVYRNQASTFEHILLPGQSPHHIVTIVVDLVNTTIKGHYTIDLDKEYGLTS
jgi:hypothetical protein